MVVCAYMFVTLVDVDQGLGAAGAESRGVWLDRARSGRGKCTTLIHQTILQFYTCIFQFVQTIAHDKCFISIFLFRRVSVIEYIHSHILIYF